MGAAGRSARNAAQVEILVLLGKGRRLDLGDLRDQLSELAIELRAVREQEELLARVKVHDLAPLPALTFK